METPVQPDQPKEELRKRVALQKPLTAENHRWLNKNSSEARKDLYKLLDVEHAIDYNFAALGFLWCAMSGDSALVSIKNKQTLRITRDELEAIGSIHMSLVIKVRWCESETAQQITQRVADARRKDWLAECAFQTGLEQCIIGYHPKGGDWFMSKVIKAIVGAVWYDSGESLVRTSAVCCKLGIIEEKLEAPKLPTKM